MKTTECDGGNVCRNSGVAFKGLGVVEVVVEGVVTVVVVEGESVIIVTREEVVGEDVDITLGAIVVVEESDGVCGGKLVVGKAGMEVVDVVSVYSVVYSTVPVVSSFPSLTED